MIQIRWKYLKRVPKKWLILWMVLTVLLLYFTVAVCSPYDSPLQHLQTKSFTVQDIRLKSPVGKRHTHTLSLTSQLGETYVLFFRVRNAAIEADLLSGQVTELTVQVLPQSLQDQLLDRYHIASLESGDTVYHTTAQTKELLSANRMGAWAGLLLCLLCWATETFFVLIGYKILVFRKIKKNF